VDRRDGVLTVRRTVSSGEVVEVAKTARSRRQVPLSPRALYATTRYLRDSTRRDSSPRRAVAC
jgi:hypothetical protein